MKHVTTASITRFLRSAQAGKRAPELSDPWRNSVMASIRVGAFRTGAAEEIERLAPRFTMVATAISLVAIVTAFWSLNGMSDSLFTAYANQGLDSYSFLWASM